MFFWNKICAIFAFSFFLITSLVAQNKTEEYQRQLPVKLSFSNSQPIGLHAYRTLIQNTDKQEIKTTTLLQTPSIKQGFFCELEMKLQNVTAIPFRFRLGSLAQCNYYEGKP
ncbi:hypothetical protein BH20BAC1_BH20BAC1_11570 [soil metagenome]